MRINNNEISCVQGTYYVENLTTIIILEKKNNILLQK